ncbi:MAG: 50S ribosomal protein L25 [Acidobacteriota bacterium]
MGSVVIEVEERSARGKNASRRLRRSGRIPAVLYGSGKPVLSVTVDPKAIEGVLYSGAGENALIELHLKGKNLQRQAMIKEYQTDPVSGDVLHADFVRIDLDTRVEVSVPVAVRGTAPGVKEQGGLLEMVHRQLKIQCLPGDIPEHVDVDISTLRIGDQVRVQDLKMGGTIVLQEKPDTVVVTVTPPRLAEEVETEAEAAEVAAEPEVILKGKKEDAEKGKAEGEGKAEGKGAK